MLDFTNATITRADAELYVEVNNLPWWMVEDLLANPKAVTQVAICAE